MVRDPRFTLPNAVTAFRMVVAAPCMLACVALGAREAFVWVLAVSFASDAIDGTVARMTGQTSRFGATLDSCADAVAYTVIAIGVTTLWPELVRAERLAFGAIVASFAVPALVGYVRFRRFTSYHTWLVKLAVGTTAAALLVALSHGPSWVLRIAAFVAVLAALEEISITAVLDAPRSNVSSLVSVLRSLRRPRR